VGRPTTLQVRNIILDLLHTPDYLLLFLFHGYSHEQAPVSCLCTFCGLNSMGRGTSFNSLRVTIHIRGAAGKRSPSLGLRHDTATLRSAAGTGGMLHILCPVRIVARRRTSVRRMGPTGAGREIGSIPPVPAAFPTQRLHPPFLAFSPRPRRPRRRLYAAALALFGAPPFVR
jgi:hypothetical protein